MEYTLTLTEEYENLLTFSGMTVESCVIDYLNKFIPDYNAKLDRDLLAKIKEASPEAIAAAVASAEMNIALKEAEAAVVVEDAVEE